MSIKSYADNNVGRVIKLFLSSFYHHLSGVSCSNLGVCSTDLSGRLAHIGTSFFLKVTSKIGKSTWMAGGSVTAQSISKPSIEIWVADGGKA